MVESFQIITPQIVSTNAKILKSELNEELPSIPKLSKSSIVDSKSNLGWCNLLINKKISFVSFEVPDILRSVGLGKINYAAPKCYGKKIELNYSQESKEEVTFNGMDYANYVNFGQLDYETL